MTGERQTGAVVVSFDCELLWGCHYVGGLGAFPYLRAYRETYRRLLELLRRFEIPATFAFVGAIALTPPELDREMESFSPAYRAWAARALDHAGSERDMLFDRDLIEAVVREPVGHELASHGLVHRRFTDMPPEDAARDFELAAAALRPYGPVPKSFVYPENRIAHLDILAASPFDLYRAVEPRWYSEVGGTMARVGHYVDQAFAVTPPLARVDRSKSPASVSDSMLLFSFRGGRGLIPVAVRQRKALRGLERAIACRGIFHLWAHPWELGGSSKSFDVLEAVFRAVAAARDAGRIEVQTMVRSVFG